MQCNHLPPTGHLPANNAAAHWPTSHQQFDVLHPLSNAQQSLSSVCPLACSAQLYGLPCDVMQRGITPCPTQTSCPSSALPPSAGPGSRASSTIGCPCPDPPWVLFCPSAMTKTSMCGKQSELEPRQDWKLFVTINGRREFRVSAEYLAVSSEKGPCL